MTITTGSAPAAMGAGSSLMAKAPAAAKIPLTNRFEGTPKVAFSPVEKKAPAFKKGKKAF